MICIIKSVDFWVIGFIQLLNYCNDHRHDKNWQNIKEGKTYIIRLLIPCNFFQNWTSVRNNAKFKVSYQNSIEIWRGEKERLLLYHRIHERRQTLFLDLYYINSCQYSDMQWSMLTVNCLTSYWLKIKLKEFIDLSF